MQYFSGFKILLEYFHLPIRNKEQSFGFGFGLTYCAFEVQICDKKIRLIESIQRIKTKTTYPLVLHNKLKKILRLYNSNECFLSQ